MSGEAVKIRSQFIPAPVDGLNLIAAPQALQPTEARKLDNYFTFDWGIRERSKWNFYASTIGSSNFPALGIVPFTSDDYSGAIVSLDGNCYRFDPTNGSFNLLGVGGQFGKAFAFNKRIFIPDETNSEIAVYNLDTDSYSATSFTVPGSFQCFDGFAYKNRAYFINRFTSKLVYGGVDAVTGALSSEVDFGSIFERGRHIISGTAWSYNSGDLNDVFLVLVNDVGEVLVYTGDSPESPNWQIVNRFDIPSSKPGYSGNILFQLGQDLLIATDRGVISLGAIMAGRSAEEQYYNKSRKIGPNLYRSNCTRSYNSPFAYFIGNGDTATTPVIYVLNYERGSWSRFTGITLDGTASADELLGLCVTTTGFGSTAASYLIVVKRSDAGTNGLYVLHEQAATGQDDQDYKYYSPFFDFGSPAQKISKHIRLVGRITGGTQYSATVGTAVDFAMTAGSEDTKSVTGSDEDFVHSELSVPGVGEWISYQFDKTGSDSHQNEISGFTAYFETGGIY